MPRLQAVELRADGDAQDAVRRRWQALHQAGLPSMADHTKPSNAPHLTVLSAPEPDAGLDDRAADLLGPLLPVTARVSGLAVLGRARVTLALLVDVDDPVVRAVMALRATVPEAQHLGWLAHVTLARRVRREDLPRALEALEPGDDLDQPLRFDRLIRWDPEADAGAGTVRTLAGVGDPIGDPTAPTAHDLRGDR